ncbi:carboxypeptidase regulatory-like domain-containing protein [Pedobacter sp. GR22-6]|uniref:carboxypeptidase regulatory-like domain-containing protein n=1 Tax=Pedobacter sp. GR22-6 TaxID=3127957 RepID=UPI00307F473E
MKKLSLNFLAVTVFAFILLAFTIVKNGGIKGNVSPADGATDVMAVSGTDTLKAVLNNGSFTFTDVKPGTYTIWVKGKAPYKDASVENVAVIDSTVTDVGEIKLLQ